MLLAYPLPQEAGARVSISPDKECPKCGEKLLGTGHKLVTFGEIRALGCPGMPLGAIEALDKPLDEE